MKTKEKANELVLKYLKLQEEGSLNWFHKILAKQCAIIAVNEIVEFMRMDDEFHDDCHMANTHWVMYWDEVKKEIEKL
jgi:hypothetical protein